MLLDWCFLPWVDLEGFVAHVVALLCEVGVCFGAVETAGVVVADVCRCVGGEGLALLAEEAVDGLVQEFAGEVPERHVHLRHSHAGVLARRLLGIVVDALTGEGTLADDSVGEESDGGVFGCRSADVLTCHAFVGVNHDHAGGVTDVGSGSVSR